MALDVYEQVRGNKIRSALLIFFFIVLVAVIGLVVGLIFAIGYFGLILAAIIAMVIGIVQYYKGDKLVLKISKAKPVQKKDYPHLVHTVEGLAIAAGVPAPKIYIIDDTAPNAFATGRDPEHSSVAVTTGLVQKLNRHELEGVISHEMSHIKNYDIKVMTLAVVLAGVVVLLSDFILRSFLWGGARGRKGGGNAFILAAGIILLILSPLFAQLVRLAISRKREYLADASAALLTRYPEGLANALEKISKDKEPLEVANKATAPLYIVNPLKGKVFLKSLFSTHPPIGERVRRLRAM